MNLQELLIELANNKGIYNIGNISIRLGANFGNTHIILIYPGETYNFNNPAAAILKFARITNIV